MRSRTRWRRIVSSAATGLIAVTGLLGAVAAPAHAVPETAVGAVTSYTYTSASVDDWIGWGGSGSYTAPSDTIEINGTARYLTVSVSNANDFWDIGLAAPEGETLHPGVYHDAERALSRTGRAPGLDVSGNGRGCNEVYGQFAIDQIETDASGAVTSLEATFTQNCDWAAAPALQGTVRFQARPLSYAYTSDHGDYIGGGRSNDYTGSTSIFGLSGSGAPMNTINYSVSGKRDNWSVRMAAPSGQSLEAGKTYRTTGLGGDDTARLEAGGNGHGCSRSNGDLTITELSYDAAGKIATFAATFTQHCEGVEPALHGTIHYLA
ncbi:hypothetical protein [Streptomyces sp. MK37H]|uniref:hypothetical protein n=1 Tax=Streptomyces sp. MK37H TaxID=2699117 RepID=UPI001B385F45|nr:hypothetical protein [Streptomyces sp. MK37H]MBP8532644.1 hypothetical protein [Streptomyces sp. MK37H]